MDYLRGDAVAQALLPTATRYLELQEDLRRLVPSGYLRDFSICQFASGTLTIAVATPSLAGKLRQTLPRLCEGLTSRGWKVNAIQLRVQPDTYHEKSSACVVRRSHLDVPAEALTHWRDLALHLESSPLKDAVLRLLSHRLER